MKTGDTHILILPGLEGGSPAHWYDRWADKLRTASRVEVDDWDNTHRDDYVTAIKGAVEARLAEADKPVILIGHSLGTIALVHAAPELPAAVRGALLVGVPDLEAATHFENQASYLPIPREPLPFPSLVIASRTDPYCGIEAAADMAGAWGSDFGDAGDCGHFNPDSGHGAWPEGLLSLGKFLNRIG